MRQRAALAVGVWIFSMIPVQAADPPAQPWVADHSYKGKDPAAHELQRLAVMLRDTNDRGMRIRLLDQFDAFTNTDEFAIEGAPAGSDEARAISMVQQARNGFLPDAVQRGLDPNYIDHIIALAPSPQSTVPQNADAGQRLTYIAATVPPGNSPNFNMYVNNPNLDNRDTRSQIAALQQRLPNEPAVSALAGAAAYRAGDFKQAAALLGGAGALADGNADLLYLRGAANMQMGKNAAAAEDLEAALRLNPQHPQAYSLLHLLRKEVPEAGGPKLQGSAKPERGGAGRDAPPSGFTAFLRAALDDRRPNPAAAALLSTAHQQERIGDWAGAEATLRRAVGAGPDNPAPRLALAEALVRRGKYKEAAEEASRVLERVPGHPGARNLRSVARSRMGDYKGALEDADAALAAKPDSALGHWARAFALAGLNRRKESLAEVQRAAALEPAYAKTAQALGLLPDDADPLVVFGESQPGAAPPPGAIPGRGARRLRNGLALLGAALSAVGAAVLYRRRGRWGVRSAPNWGDLSAPHWAAPGPAAEPAPMAPSAAPPAGTFGPGTRIGGCYLVEKELGRGSMGVVFKAQDLSLNRPVAVKMLRGYARGRSEPARRLQQEAQLVAALRHPNIVQIHNLAQEGDDLLLVFEYVEGRPLNELISDFTRLSPKDASGVVSQVAAALDHAHERRVIHCDLKPANILVQPDGKALVMDFGLAHQARVSAAKETGVPNWGSPAYMAPEQEDGAVSASSDLYALGACLYEMLTGEAPFQGPDGIGQKRRAEFVLPCARVPSLPPGADALIRRALDARPQARFGTGRELAQAAAALVAPNGAVGRAPS